ncbi:hypothetical protein ACFQ4V_04550 [Thermoactinomyces vulgaris]|jgi:hypothetical protein
MNLFKKRKITNHFDKDYKEFTYQSRKSFDDPLMQYNHFKQQVEQHEHQYKYLAQFLAEIAQYEISSIRSKEITFTTDCVENMWRSVIDLLRHLEKDLPEGVYEYNYLRLKWFAEECLQFAHKEKYTDQPESQGSVKTK